MGKNKRSKKRKQAPAGGGKRGGGKFRRARQAERQAEEKQQQESQWVPITYDVYGRPLVQQPVVYPSPPPPPPPAVMETVEEEDEKEEGEEEEKKTQQKTRLCRFTYACARMSCPDAHPLGRRIDTPEGPAPPCPFGSKCRRGDRCAFLHGPPLCKRIRAAEGDDAIVDMKKARLSSATANERVLMKAQEVLDEAVQLLGGGSPAVAAAATALAAAAASLPPVRHEIEDSVAFVADAKSMEVRERVSLSEGPTTDAQLEAVARFKWDPRPRMAVETREKWYGDPALTERSSTSVPQCAMTGAYLNTEGHPSGGPLIISSRRTLRDMVSDGDSMMLVHCPVEGTHILFKFDPKINEHGIDTSEFKDVAGFFVEREVVPAQDASETLRLVVRHRLDHLTLLVCSEADGLHVPDPTEEGEQPMTSVVEIKCRPREVRTPTLFNQEKKLQVVLGGASQLASYAHSGFSVRYATRLSDDEARPGKLWFNPQSDFAYVHKDEVSHEMRTIRDYLDVIRARVNPGDWRVVNLFESHMLQFSEPFVDAEGGKRAVPAADDDLVVTNWIERTMQEYEMHLKKQFT